MKKVRIGVVGLGLMGGSVALAAQAAGYPVSFYEPFAEVRSTRFAGATRAETLRDLGQVSDLLLIAIPISAFAGLASELAQAVRTGTTVSDLASVKGHVAKILAPALIERAIYIPTHPMAGSERSGSDYARANLFQDSITIVSADFVSSPRDLATIERFWKHLGSKPVRLPIKEHDQVVGAISHFPHLVAGALLEALRSCAPEALDFAGPGLRDLTRVAGGSADLWTEILMTNRDALAVPLKSLVSQLERLSGVLGTGDKKQLRSFLEAARQIRGKIST